MVIRFALALSAALPGGSHQQASPVVREEFVDSAAPRAQLEDQGGGFARLESLPPSERQRLSAAQFVPWQVVRTDSGGLEDVVLDWQHPIWPSRLRPAQFLVVQPTDATATLATGTFIAADRYGSRVFVAPPDGAPRYLDLGYERSRELSWLTPQGVLHGYRSGSRHRGLWWTPFDLGGASGVGVGSHVGELHEGSFGTQQTFVRHGLLLLWVSGREEVTALDLDSGSTRKIPFPEAEHHTLERAHHGWLFSRATGKSDVALRGELCLTNLATCEQFIRPAPIGLSAWLPEGLFVARSFIDPVGGERVELSEALWIHGETVRTEAGEIFHRAKRDDPWRRLHLGESVPRDAASLNAEAFDAVARALDAGDGLELDAFMFLVRDLPQARTHGDVALLRRVLLTDGVCANARARAAGNLENSSLEAARLVLLEALSQAGPGTHQLRLARCVATFGVRSDARAIEKAIPVDSLPPGMRHGDAAVRVAETLAILGDNDSVTYLEALYERAPFPRVRRALESVRNADRFRSALEASRGG